MSIAGTNLSLGTNSSGTNSSFDQSTWLAKRVVDSRDMPDKVEPVLVVLPGARVAIPHDRLRAYQSAGLDERAVVERVNARWSETHQEATSRHRAWVEGPYASGVQRMRERAAEDAAEAMRRRAAFERFMEDHAGDS